MALSAKVLVIEAKDCGDAGVAEGLRGYGLEPVALSPDECGDGVLRAHANHDVVLLNLASRAARADAATWIRTAALLSEHAAAARIPAVMIGEPSDLIGRNAGEGWADVLPAPASAAFIASRINTLLRLNTLQAELNRRMATCARYGLDAPLALTRPTQIGDAAILVLSGGACFGAIEDALGGVAELVGAFTPAGARDYLAARGFDAVIMDADLGADAVLDFAAQIRLNPASHALPLLLAAAPDGADWLGEALNAGVSEILAAPLDAELIRHRAMALAAESRFRETLKSTYRQARHMATSDALTGLYSRGFLMEHLSAMLNEGSAARRLVSLAGFQIRNLPGLNAEHGYIAGDRVIRQVGEMIAQVMRGEDLVARYDGATFAALLPETRRDDAEAAVKRVAAVVRFTEFAALDADRPVKVDLRTCVAESHPGERPETLVARGLDFAIEQDL